MSISVVKRREACLRLLRSEFDLEATIAWVLKEYADDPFVLRAKNKEKLARNIVTIGGSGDQQELNMLAFQQALATFATEQRQSSLAALRAEKESLVQERDKLVAALDEERGSVHAERRSRDNVQGDLNKSNERVQDLQETITDQRLKIGVLEERSASTA